MRSAGAEKYQKVHVVPSTWPWNFSVKVILRRASVSERTTKVKTLCRVCVEFSGANDAVQWFHAQIVMGSVFLL